MKVTKKVMGFLLSAFMFIVVFAACLHYAGNARDYYVDNPGIAGGRLDFKKTSMEKLIADYVNTGVEREIVVSGAGDLMFFEWQLERAYDDTSETFDFSKSFSYILKYMENSDLVIGNLETTFAGKDNGKYKNFYGYGANVSDMNFNTPDEAATAIAQAGFDIVSTANEHATDSGTEGLLHTLDTASAAGLTVVGTKKTASDGGYAIVKKNGLNIGVAAYTAKAPTLDEASQGLVNVITDYSEEKLAAMCGDVAGMRKEGAEAVVVMLHFGENYAEVPDDYQKNAAHKLIEAGADVVFGSHPHTLQPLEIYPVTESDNTVRNGVIIYSMGNFLSSQQYKGGIGNRDIGALFDVVFGKLGDKVRIKEIHVTPTYTNWTEDAITVIPVCEAKDVPESFEGVLDKRASSRIHAAYETIIPSILASSGVNYTYSDYKYKISLENS